MKYLFKKIEPKWQAKWEEAKVFEAKDNSDKPKFYGLVEFPYPSGAGMHVGHIKAYSSLEVISRKRRMEGYNVLFPIGFDAFGLPTENYAVKTGTHPRIITDENIKRFSNQLKKVGFSFDWNRVIDTTDEDYYKWTQWIFLKMFEKGLVFRDRTLVNYCPHCKVVLSNEDSQGGKCDICHSDVVQKSKDVWYLRITQYADKLLEGLKDVDYPDNVKQQQIHWIGKSKGAFVNFDVDGIDEPAADADSDTQEDADAQDSADADKTADAEGTKTEYPLTITTYDYDGNEIETTYEKAPEKVLAVYQGSIETMLALGLEDRLVATAGLDNEVPDELKDAFSKTNYLDEFTPSLETVTMLEPDMILSWSSLFSDKNLGNVTDWIDKGCNTYYNTNTRPDGDRTLENEFTDILNLGKIFDVQDKAQAIVDDAKAVIDKTLTATADVEEKPSVMVLEPLGEDITNYGAKSLGGDMVTQLGATLANPDASTAGKEDIIAANPDVIFVVYMPYAGDDPETVKESQLAVIKDDEALQSLDAVKNGRVYPIMLSEMYASATRTQDGIETFAKGLYPDVNLD